MALDYWVEFFDDLQNVKGRSKNTVQAYRRDLELYEEFKNRHKDISFIFEFLKKHNLSTRSQARVISSVRTYLKFLESKGEKVDDLRQLKPPKVKVNLPKVVSLTEYRKLHQACVVENKYKAARNQLTLLLLFGLGVRVTELVGLNLTDFNETDAWLKVLGKGGKERIIPLTDNLLNELNAYLQTARPELAGENEKSILVNDRGKRPSRVDVWRWLSAWSASAGFEDTINPHRFRHGCATALLEGGADLRSIQMLLGHSSLQTTQIYTSVSTKALKKQVNSHHPLGSGKKTD